MNYPRLNCSRLVLAMGLLLPVPLCAGESSATVANQSVAPPTNVVPEASEEAKQKLAELVRKAQDRIERDPELDGAVVWGIQVVPGADGSGQMARLEGKLYDKQQGARVEEIVMGLLKSDRYWWVGEGNFTATSEEMIVGEGSEELATRLYALGLEHFWAGRYEDADRVLARAVAESPKDDYLRYWRVVTALALDNEERAEQKLTPLLRKYTLGSRSPAIASEFERFQGPIRRQLQDLEDRLLETLKI